VLKYLRAEYGTILFQQHELTEKRPKAIKATQNQ
jgi:hypothetical protein